MTEMPRDLIGYGAHPPDIAWPNGARVAVNFVMNFEEGSEYSIGDGDGRSETALTEVAAGNATSAVTGNAGAYICDNEVFFIVSTSLVPESSGVRATAFIHDGNFTQGNRGADTLPEPMEPLADLVDLLP